MNFDVSCYGFAFNLDFCVSEVGAFLEVPYPSVQDSYMISVPVKDDSRCRDTVPSLLEQNLFFCNLICHFFHFAACVPIGRKDRRAVGAIQNGNAGKLKISCFAICFFCGFSWKITSQFEFLIANAIFPERSEPDTNSTNTHEWFGRKFR